MTNDQQQRDASPKPAIDLVGRQVSVSVVASVVGMALRYVAALLTTRILGVALFGSYVQTQTIVHLLSVASTMGLAPGAVPFVARSRLDGDERQLRAVVRCTWAITLVASTVVATALFCAAPWLASTAYHDAPLEGVLRWLAPMVVFAALMFASLAIAQGFKAMRLDALVEKVVAVGGTLAGLVVVWWFGLGVEGVLVATLVGPAAGLLCAIAFVSTRVPGVLRPGTSAAPWPLRSLLTTCWPLLGSGLIASVLSSVDVMLLGVLRDSSEVGLYGAAARLLPAATVVHQSAARMFYAHASERFVAGDLSGVGHLYRRTARWSIWAGLGTAMMLVIWGREILGLFGPEYAAGGPVLGLLALGATVTSMTGACGKALIATGRLRQNMLNVIAMLLLNVVLNVLWIPEHGAYGAAFATLVASLVVRLAQVVQVWYLFRMHPWSRDTAVALLVAGLAYALVPSIRHGFGGSFGWLVALAAFGLVWFGTFVVFGAGEEERQFLRSLLARRRPHDA